MLTIRSDFHNRQARVRATISDCGNYLLLSARQWSRVRDKICGNQTCACVYRVVGHPDTTIEIDQRR